MFKYAWIVVLLVANSALAQVAPEQSTGYQKKSAVTSKSHMVVTANQHASRAANAILSQGGSAVDAAIAAQLVLNLVEPQSSGLGGGGFLLSFQAEDRTVYAIDGREEAPMAIKETNFLDDVGKPLPFMEAVKGGKSVGVPGLLSMLHRAHRYSGKLAWAELFTPAIKLAKEGFVVSERLAKLLKSAGHLQANGWLSTDIQEGQLLKNAQFAALLEKIAQGGPAAFYQGDTAKEIVALVQKEHGTVTALDLANYQSRSVMPVCGYYQFYRICSMGPPSSGGLAVIQAMGILDHLKLNQYQPDSAKALHIMAEALRLAFADRNQYVADDRFVNVPIKQMLDRDYLSNRSALIDPSSRRKTVQPGQFDSPPIYAYDASNLERPSTTHISIVDKQGNAVSMTTSIEHAFGSGLMTHGMLLNNQLTDFSFMSVKDGRPIANRIEPGKRPRSSMSPVLVFDEQGRLLLAIGSPGGARIISYVTHVLALVLAWDVPLEEAIHMGRFATTGERVELETDQHSDVIAAQLVKLGHQVVFRPLTSGLHGIYHKHGLLVGVADPRREGTALAQ